MLLFLIVGGVGLLLLVGGLLLGDVLDPGDGLTPAIGAGLGAFGVGGALLLGPLGALLAAAGGAVAAVALGVAAYALTRALIGRDSPPVRTTDLIGVFGTVVTRIPAEGLGEVVLPQAGTRVKLAARSYEPVPSGTPVYVTEVLSSTSVTVQRADLL